MKVKLRQLLADQHEVADDLELRLSNLTTEDIPPPDSSIIPQSVYDHIGTGPMFRPVGESDQRKNKPKAKSKDIATKNTKRRLSKAEEALALKKKERNRIKRLPDDDYRKDRWLVKTKDPEDLAMSPGPGLVQYPDGSQVLLHEWLGEARTSMIVSTSPLLSHST
jgi:hypothetical protein